MADLYVAARRAVAGDVAGMERLIEVALARPHASTEVLAGASAVRALRHLMSHDLNRAVAHMDTGVAALGPDGSSGAGLVWGLWVLLRSVLDDRGAQARDRLRGSPAALLAVNRGGLRYADAVAAGRAGRHGVAEALFASADQILAEQGWWRRLLRLLALEAAVADGWGEPVVALRADLEAFERTGDQHLARICRDLLRRAGAPTRRGRGGTPVPTHLRGLGVTTREMDVLVLIADGLTNREIAERLFVSPRTVETHVANLLTKTGTASRAELRALAAQPPTPYRPRIPRPGTSRDAVRIPAGTGGGATSWKPHTAGTAHDSAVTECYQERSYPQFDCTGSYLWIWERQIQAEGRTEVIAREVHRDRPPSGPEKVT